MGEKGGRRMGKEEGIGWERKAGRNRIGKEGRKRKAGRKGRKRERNDITGSEMKRERRRRTQKSKRKEK